MRNLTQKSTAKLPVLVTVAFIATMFISGCSMLNKPTVGGLANTAKDEAEVEYTEGAMVILESKMEKTEGYDFSEDKGIIISGTAKYIPADVNPVSFEEYGEYREFKFNLLDADGNKVRSFNSFHYQAELGEDGEIENIEPNEPFPFILEGYTIDPEDWEEIEDYEFIEFD